MKEIIKLHPFIALGFGIFVSACTPNKNSLSAHAECVKDKTNNGLSQEVSRGLCSLEHQKIILASDSEMKAQLSAYKYSQEGFLFETWYQNKPNSAGSSSLITQIAIELTVGNNSKILEWNDLWIEPSKGEAIKRFIKFSDFGLATGAIPKKGQWSWRVIYFNGLIID